MNRLQKIVLLLIWGIALASPVFARENDNWKQAISEKFHVIGNASAEDTAQITRKMEAFRRSFFNLFQQTESKSPIPTRILIFKSETDYATNLKNKNDLSEYSFREGQDANYIVVVLNGAETDFRQIYHHYFHYLLSNHIGKSKIPAWLNEGLARVYENFQIKAFQNRAQNKYELLRQSKLLPSEIIFNTDYYSLNQQQDHGNGVFYAQSAAVVDYLIEQSRDQEFRQFISLISAGISVNEALLKSFQTDLPAVENNLKSFIEHQPNENTEATTNQKPESADLKLSLISPAELEAFFGDYLYQSKNYDEAELHLLKSLSLDSQAGFPKSTLGLVKLRQYKPDEAFQHLEKTVEFNDANYLTYYRYAYALSRQGMTEYGFVSNYDAETAEKMRGFLNRSIELNPDFAESYNLFAFVSFVRNDELEKGLSYITKALAGSPGNEQFLLRKAELDMRKESFTPARKNAMDIYRNAANAGLRLYAQNTVQRIDSTEYQFLLSRRREKYPYSDAISEKPFSDEEIVRLRAKAMRESLTAALRQPAPGEMRILGNITNIDCKQNRVDFTVQTADKIINLYAESFEMLKLMSFNSTLSKSQIGCGTSNVENAVIIYKNPKGSQFNISGEIVSVEFVPKEFTLSVNK